MARSSQMLNSRNLIHAFLVMFYVTHLQLILSTRKINTVALKINQPININPTLSGRRCREVEVSVSPWELGCWTEKVGSEHYGLF